MLEVNGLTRCAINARTGTRTRTSFPKRDFKSLSERLDRGSPQVPRTTSVHRCAVVCNRAATNSATSLSA